MGDRCTVYVTCRKEDAASFVEGGLVEDGTDPENEHLVQLCDEQANYADNGLLSALAARGVAYFGFHTAGANYGPCVFASDGKKYAEATSSEVGGEPVARVGEHGGVNAADVHKAARYFGTLARAKALLNVTPSGPAAAQAGNPVHR